MSTAATSHAYVAYEEDGRWQLETLPPAVTERLHLLIHAMRQQPSDLGTIGMVYVDDDFFVLTRLTGERVRLLISDAGAAIEYPIAADVLDEIGEPVPGDEELDHTVPAGDFAIIEDLGMAPLELRTLCEDPDHYPDEVLAAVAKRVGFGEAFQRTVSATWPAEVT